MGKWGTNLAGANFDVDSLGTVFQRVLYGGEGADDARRVGDGAVRVLGHVEVAPAEES